MRKLFNGLLVLALLVMSSIFFKARAVESWTQTLMMDVATGVSANGAGVLQTGQVSTLSALASNTTLIALVTAPSSGSIYARGIWIEKATTDTGSLTLVTGTTTTTPCDTGAATVLSLTSASGQTLRFGYHPVGIKVAATKILCGSTDASTTAFRVLAQ